MEHDPLVPASPEPKGDKEKKTRRKKHRFVAPLPVETTDKLGPREEKKPERSALDEALANLAIQEREQAETRPSKSRKKKRRPPATETENSHEIPALAPKDREVRVAEATDATEETADSYEPLLVHELRLNEFSGGEVIIKLQGDKPVVEHIIPPETTEVAVMHQPGESAPTTSEPSQTEIVPAEQHISATEESRPYLDMPSTEQLAAADHRFSQPNNASEAVPDRRFSEPNPSLDPAIVPEKAATPQPELAAEYPQVPAGHHLETSAWHAIEIDNKTGRPVDNPTFAYGHEYYRERAPEAVPAQERNAAAGDIALTAAALAHAPSGGMLPPPADSNHVPSASMQGTPLRTQDAADTDKAQLPAGALWPWVTALIVIICLIALIR